MTTYKNPIECPECGQETYELYHATSGRQFIDKNSNSHFPQKVLMCDACYESSDKGLKTIED